MKTPCPEIPPYVGCCVPVLPEGFDCVRMESCEQCDEYNGQCLPGGHCLADEGEYSCAQFEV